MLEDTDDLLTWLLPPASSSAAVIHKGRGLIINLRKLTLFKVFPYPDSFLEDSLLCLSFLLSISVVRLLLREEETGSLLLE